MEYDGYGYFIFFLHFVAGFATFLVPKSRDANALWHLGTWFGSLTGDFGVPLSWFNFAEAILTLACSLGRFLKALRRVNANFARWTCVLPIFVGCFWRPEAVRLLQQAAARLLCSCWRRLGEMLTVSPWNFGDVFSFASNFGACQELAEEQVQEGDVLIFKRFCAHRIHLARCDHNDCYPSRWAGVARCLFGHWTQATDSWMPLNWKKRREKWYLGWPSWNSKSPFEWLWVSMLELDRCIVWHSINKSNYCILDWGCAYALIGNQYELLINHWLNTHI